MRPNANIIKTYWQAMDEGGGMYLYYDEKPELSSGTWRNHSQYTKAILFPIHLTPLQIAEITVNEDGTWSYEIEREEGFYCVKYPDNSTGFWQYRQGKWYYASSDKNVVFMPENYTISSTRIPDECII